jgi:hypothetical protein
MITNLDFNQLMLLISSITLFFILGVYFFFGKWTRFLLTWHTTSVFLGISVHLTFLYGIYYDNWILIDLSFFLLVIAAGNFLYGVTRVRYGSYIPPPSLYIIVISLLVMFISLPYVAHYPYHFFCFSTLVVMAYYENALIRGLPSETVKLPTLIFLSTSAFALMIIQISFVGELIGIDLAYTPFVSSFLLIAGFQAHLLASIRLFNTDSISGFFSPCPNLWYESGFNYCLNNNGYEDVEVSLKATPTKSLRPIFNVCFNYTYADISGQVHCSTTHQPLSVKGHLISSVQYSRMLEIAKKAGMLYCESCNRKILINEILRLPLQEGDTEEDKID